MKIDKTPRRLKMYIIIIIVYYFSRVARATVRGLYDRRTYMGRISVFLVFTVR